MKRFSISILGSLLFLLAFSAGAQAVKAPTLADESPPVKTVRRVEKPNPFREFSKVPVPSLKWVLAKAQCETGTNWKNKGTYGGAFGFMHRGYEVDNSGLPKNSTWGRWGGFLFAKHPSKASPEEQVIVYLRVNWGGWHRPNGMFRPPSYSQDTGNQCYKFANKTAGKISPKIRNMDEYYRQFQVFLFFQSRKP